MQRWQAPPESYDINVTPDKRTVLFSNESALLALVRGVLDEMFTTESCTFSVQQPLEFSASANSARPSSRSSSANPGTGLDVATEGEHAPELVTPAVVADVPLTQQGGGAVDGAGAAVGSSRSTRSVGSYQQKESREGGARDGALADNNVEKMAHRLSETDHGIACRLGTRRNLEKDEDLSKQPALDGCNGIASMASEESAAHASGFLNDQPINAARTSQSKLETAAVTEQRSSSWESEGGVASRVAPMDAQARPSKEKVVEDDTIASDAGVCTAQVEHVSQDSRLPASAESSMPGAHAVDLDADDTALKRGTATDVQSRCTSRKDSSRVLEHVTPPCVSMGQPLSQAALQRRKDVGGSVDVSVASLFALLKSLRRDCEAEGMPVEAELQLACRTFAQQIGVLREDRDSFAMLGQLTTCATRYVKGWLAHHTAPAALPEVKIQATLAATCGWDWLEEHFDSDNPSTASVAEAFAQLGDALGGEQPERKVLSAQSKGLRATSTADYAVEGEGGALCKVADDLVIHFSLAQVEEELEGACEQHVLGSDTATATVEGKSLGPSQTSGHCVPEAGNLEAASRVSTTEVEDELRRVLPKAQFRCMEVLGQFNLGFIIARTGEDLFIVDQHAADEKFQFETLQNRTKIHTQRLIAPLALRLTAADELVIMEHLHVFRKNGFEIEVDVDALPTQRLRLVALPFSKDTVFGPSDISELVMLLSEAPGQSCRLPKLRSMFAMRACRSAIMIGTALEPSKMRQLVLQLAQLDQPWNCPHGRPTIRHLCDMEALSQTGAARAFGAAL